MFRRKLNNFIQGVPIKKVVFDFWYLFHGKESIKMRLYVLQAFHEDFRYSDDFELLNQLKFVQILQYLCHHWRYKMVDLILKISGPGVSDIRCVNCRKLKLLCSSKKCHMDRRRYKRRHLIPMFIGTPYINTVYAQNTATLIRSLSQQAGTFDHNFFYKICCRGCMFLMKNNKNTSLQA